MKICRVRGDRRAMLAVLEIARTGVDSLARHPLRSLVTAGTLTALLVPYIAGMGVSKGIERQAAEAVEFGADLYVRGRQLGRDAPLPRAAAVRIAAIDGVQRVVPRIVGAIRLGKEREPVILVGLPAGELPTSISCVAGRLFEPNGEPELVIGTELAGELALEPGSSLPPFYRNRRGERVSRVVGVFDSDVAMWQARVAFCSLETAAEIFDQPRLVTELLVYCRPGYEEPAAREISRLGSLAPAAATDTVTPKIVSKNELEALLPKGLLHREGLFNLHFVLAFAMGIGVVLLSSGLGLSERRREIAILKATGWQTDEVLFRGAVESACLAAAAASVSVVLAWVWLKPLNGYWIAGVFMSGVGVSPTFDVPSRLTPVPALLGFAIAFVVTGSGTLYSSWRAATAPPSEALR